MPSAGSCGNPEFHITSHPANAGERTGPLCRLNNKEQP